MILIGIDPGIKTGFAVWNRIPKTLELDTFNFHKTCAMLTYYQTHYTGEFKVFIEDPNGNKPLYDNERVKGDLARLMNQKNIGGIFKIYSESCKIAQNVGSNKREASLLIEFMQLHNIPFEAKTPSKSSLTKLNAETFNRITKYEGKSSQHARDAAGLVFGR